MAKRTGLTTLRYLMRQACRIIVTWRPVIVQVYPENVALHLALDTAMAACEVLVAEIDDVLPTGV